MFCLAVPTLIYLWDIYIFPGYCCREICGSIPGIYKSLTETWMWKLRVRPHNSQKRNTYSKWDFPCSAAPLLLPGLFEQRRRQKNIPFFSPAFFTWMYISSIFWMISLSLSLRMPDSTRCWRVGKRFFTGMQMRLPNQTISSHLRRNTPSQTTPAKPNHFLTFIVHRHACQSNQFPHI